MIHVLHFLLGFGLFSEANCLIWGDGTCPTLIPQVQRTVASCCFNKPRQSGDDSKYCGIDWAAKIVELIQSYLSIGRSYPRYIEPYWGENGIRMNLGSGHHWKRKIRSCFPWPFVTRIHIYASMTNKIGTLESLHSLVSCFSKIPMYSTIIWTLVTGNHPVWHVCSGVNIGLHRVEKEVVHVKRTLRILCFNAQGPSLFEGDIPLRPGFSQELFHPIICAVCLRLLQNYTPEN